MRRLVFAAMLAPGLALAAFLPSDRLADPVAEERAQSIGREVRKPFVKHFALNLGHKRFVVGIEPVEALVQLQPEDGTAELACARGERAGGGRRGG